MAISKKLLFISGSLLLLLSISQFIPATSLFIDTVAFDPKSPTEFYCLQLGGKLFQERTSSGSFDTTCVFKTGTVCKVDALYKGECSSLDVSTVHVCEDSERTLDFCHSVASPVCATLKRGNKETYMNGCHACLNPKVEFFQLGDCPDIAI